MSITDNGDGTVTRTGLPAAALKALTNPYLPPTLGEAIKLAGGIRPGAMMFADPLQKAVDDYLLMERKARAWDDLRRQMAACDMPAWVEEMDRLVHPAQDSSTR